MANIVPKLNLNRTPFIVTNNSMVFAKNIRIDIDNTIHKDYSIESLQNVGNIFHDNLLTRIISDFRALNTEIAKHYLELIDKTLKNNYSSYSVIKVIPDNKSFYILLQIGTSSNSKNIIVKFDEETDLFYPCNCNWTYNHGDITGSVINNLLGETILIIAEKNNENNIPLKCINLSKSSYEEDESVYTQTPKIPVTNLIYTSDFKFSIPNGVYQFFIRYKIRDNFYTNWFPASKELFAGNKHTTDTIFGTLGYHIDNINSDNSFIFIVEHLLYNNISNFENFQIGFIISNEGAIKGRAWKHFSFKTTQINFDYKVSEAEEVEITDFTKPIFNVYNVGNICSFKNKLYISNYKETDFNQDLQKYADKVNIDIYYKKDQKINTDDKTIIYKDSLCILNNEGNITGLSIKYGGDKDFNSLLDSTFYDVFTKAITETKAYETETTEKCYYNIGGGLGLVDVGIYLKVKKESSKITKPTKIILSDYAGDDNEYDFTNEIEENLLLNFITAFTSRFIAFYNIGYINIHDYKFYSAGSNNANNYFKESNYLLTADTPINPISIRLTNNNYNDADPNTYDDITINISIDSSLIQNSAIPIINNTTLIPYQIYRFYIHYVKETGETTNGYLVKEIKIENKENEENNVNSVIYPIFNNIEIPSGYSACFFSIAHVKNQTSVIYNNKYDTNKYNFEGTCFELNTRLFNFNSNPKIWLKNNTHDKDISIEGTYYNSADTRTCRYFGAEGIITFSKNDIKDDVALSLTDKKVFIVNNYTNVDETNLELIKCTPYINKSKYTNYNNYNLLGYICSIYPLKRDNTTSIYTDSTTLYKKSNEVDSINYLKLTEYNKYKEPGSTNFIGDLTIAVTEPILIYSNFNLNYIELTEELKPKYITYYNRSENDTSSDNRTSETKFFNLVPSQNLSTIYKLNSVYYNYTRKTYSVYNKNDIYKFDNTIRSSKLAGDEDKLSIFEFDADDYYNIPTNRGKIVNLISVGDAILVHTRDSMFKFTGSNTLQSNTGEIQQTESDVFQTGVNEIFGSDFGFAGLQNKNAAITTEAGYIFYDEDSKIIYIYSGNGQIVKLSDSIEKLLRYDILYNVSFANDYYNNRFFACLHFKSGNVTLSYSFNQESRSFISLHDFNFDKAFNTKTKCYFITSNNNICRIDKSSYGLYRHLNNINDKIYPYYIKKINETFSNSNGKPININTTLFCSIVDVIENINYENVKTLNYINWSCAIINNEFPIYGDNIKYFNALASSDEKYPCKNITIYTDTCSTEKLDCSNISNDKSISDINSDPYYKYPRYNQGFWTLNYFRNKLNDDDKFKYLTQYNNGIKGDNYISDNNSLIEGKYFVARFTFDCDKDFKFETINFNYNIKL